jgi:hypothetical protein
VLDAPALHDEAKLLVEGDRGVVVREDAEHELVEAAFARELDRRCEERRADAASALVARDHHPQVGEPERSGVEHERAEPLGAVDGDERVLELEPRGALLDVGRRLGCDAVPLLGDRCEQLRERTPVALLCKADVDRRIVAEACRSTSS